MEKYLDITKPRYCLISYRAGAWQYRRFPDFLNSGFKMARKIEGIAKVLHTVRSLSNGASISHTSPWSQPFPE